MPVNQPWNDPQEHGCDDCRFWVPPRGYVSSPCRRRAPITHSEYGKPIWPATMKDDWCGDWEMRDGDPTAVQEARETE